jgi:hypothetical protein
MKWEQKLLKVDDLVARSNGTLYDRIKLLAEVWADGEYLAFHAGDMDAAEEMLDAKLGDYGIGFMEALAAFKHFPKRAHWVDTPIRQMLAEALEAERRDRKESASPSTRKGPVPRKEHEKLEEEMRHVNSRADSLAEENGRLRDEVRVLREDNAVLRGRVEELEKLLSKQYA